MTDFSQKLQFAPDVIVQAIDGEALILKLQDEEVFALNETAARIVQLIGSGQRLDALIDVLCREYGMARDAVEQEVGSLVEALLERGLLVVDHAQADS